MSKWHLIQPLQREIYKKPTLISYVLVRNKSERNLVAKVATKPEFLVAKEKLYALATVSVAILSPD